MQYYGKCISFCNDVLLLDYHSTSRTLFAKIKLDASNLFLKRSNAGEQSISFKFSFYVGNQAKGSFVKYEQVAA